MRRPISTYAASLLATLLVVTFLKSRDPHNCGIAPSRSHSLSSGHGSLFDRINDGDHGTGIEAQGLPCVPNVIQKNMMDRKCFNYKGLQAIMSIGGE